MHLVFYEHLIQPFHHGLQLPSFAKGINSNLREGAIRARGNVLRIVNAFQVFASGACYIVRNDIEFHAVRLLHMPHDAYNLRCLTLLLVLRGQTIPEADFASQTQPGVTIKQRVRALFSVLLATGIQYSPLRLHEEFLGGKKVT